MPGDALDWMDDELTRAGRARTGDVEVVRVRPWGSVWRAPTDAGTVFLKEPAAATAFEVPLYDLLMRVVPGRILTPIALDVDRGWLLLPDGGPVVSEQHDGEALLGPMERIAPQYAQLQLDLAPHVDDLLEVGLADMRPERMLERFDEALGSVHPGPEHAARLRQVAELRPWFGEASARLSELPGGASLDHNDLHGGNVFLDPGGGARFFDWGDAVVSHPFASLLVLRSVVRWLQGVHEETPAERRVVDAYLEPFGPVTDEAEVRETVELACELGKVARSLVWGRAVAPMPPDEDDPDGFRTAPVDWLLEVLDGPAVS